MRKRDIGEPVIDEPELDLQPYLALAWHWAWLFILAALLGGAAGYLNSRRQIPIYASSTTVMIDAAPTSRAADYSSIYLSERLSDTYSILMLNRPILEKVREELGMTDLETQGIEINKIPNTQLLNIRVLHADRKLAAEIANKLVEVFGQEVVKMQSERYAVSKASLQSQITDMEEQLEETAGQIRQIRNEAERANLEQKQTLYKQIYSNLLMSLEQVRLAEAQTISNIVQVESALPGGQVSPRVRRSAIQAALFGLLLAVGLVFGLNFLDNTVKNPDVLSRRLGLSTLGMIASHETRPGQVVTIKHPRSPVSEAFRALRTNVRFAGVDRPLRKLMVTSPMHEEGKTTISANLAVVLAQSGERVTLVDSDLRRPMVHKTLGLRDGTGLSGLFVQDTPDIEKAMTPAGIAGLRAVLSGALPPNPSELLGSNKMKEILDRMLESSDIVILDTPPIMSVTDAAVLASQVDAVLVVFRPGATKTSVLTQAVEQLRLVNANLIGLVANNVNMARVGYNTYYYRRYYSKYAYYSEEARGGWKANTRRLAKKIARKTGLKKRA
ncbi:MAG: polysaccharide biosynthesis tyrosine autokinase [Acidobacteriota bacterium]|nr:polysaccharide biosynthesis tyrosine autokinase [Acidobacteriota bacterium]